MKLNKFKQCVKKRDRNLAIATKMTKTMSNVWRTMYQIPFHWGMDC